MFFYLQGQNPFESEEFSKTGSHLLESAFDFDCSARLGKSFLFFLLNLTVMEKPVGRPESSACDSWPYNNVYMLPLKIRDVYHLLVFS